MPNKPKFDPASREEQAVRELGIGYGRVMQIASDLWNAQYPGAAFSLGPCRGLMVPCPCPAWERDANGHCNVCCGSRQVTERVRDMLSEMLRLKRALVEAADAADAPLMPQDGKNVKRRRAERVAEWRKLAAIGPGTMEPR